MKKVPGFDCALVFAVIVVCTSLAACAQQVATRQGPTARDFVDATVETGYLEIAAAKLAAEKSQNLQVQRIAIMMLQAYSRVNDSAAQLALAGELETPLRPSRDGQALLEKLAKLDGAEFDQAYSQEMLKAHKQALLRFQEAAQYAPDKAIQSFAESQLPGMRDRMRVAQTLPGSNLG